MTESYPVNYYVPTKTRLEDGSVLHLAKKISPEGGQKTLKESGDYMEDLLASTRVTRCLHASLKDVGGKKQWKADLFGGKWDIVGEVDTAYELFKTAWKAYKYGEIPSANNGLALGLKSVASAEAVFRALGNTKSVPGLSYIHHARAAYYLLNGAFFITPYSIPTGKLSVIYGEYLDAQASYEMSEFLETKVNRTFLSCRAFENDEKLRANQAIHWTWANSASLVAQIKYLAMHRSTVVM
ncbi:MAG: hypothetical protein KA436_06115 [Oligoflexales bacterium]|nr:hypothetical protein [Oligoflexales bacterium]